MAWSAKADGNQAAIVSALRKVGALVLSLHRVGGGCPDLLVQFAGITHLIEVKMPAQRYRLTPAQKEFHGAWVVKIVTSPVEALQAIGLKA